MRIIHLYDEHAKVAQGWGSVVTVILNIAEQLVEMKHDVTIIERKWRDTPEVETLNGIMFRRFRLHIGSDIPGEDVPYKLIRNPLGLSRMILDRIEFASKLNKYLENIDFDVLHVHVPFVANILIKINKQLRNKVIYTFHAGEEIKRLGIDKNSQLVLRMFLPDLHIIRRVKVCTVLNPSLKNELIKLGIDDGKIKVVPNGINTNEFGNFDRGSLVNIRKKYCIPMDAKLIMFAGTITPRKGVKYLLKAIKMLVDRGYKNVFLVLTGDITLDKKYFEKCFTYARRKLSSYVLFLGGIPYDDLKILYSACDIFVLPSFREGDPIALKEALASGKPLVGSNVSGIPMQIRNGWNGFLIEPGNEVQLVEKLEYLIENDHDRKRMGKNSRKLAKKKFDWSKIAEEYINIYKHL